MKRDCGKWGLTLREHGYKCTESREVIPAVLEATDRHLSSEEVYREVYKSHPNIGLTTIYRTLELLVKLDIVDKFEFGDGRSRYELSENYSHKSHHHHLICSECGDITDYSDFMDEELIYLKKTESELGQKYKFEINSHLIRFYGKCNGCQKRL